MLGFFSIFYALFLIANAIVIFDDRRVLTPLKLPLGKEYRDKLGRVRQRIVELISAVRTLFELALLIINMLCVLYEVFFG